MANDLPNLQINANVVQAPHLPNLPTPRVFTPEVATPQVNRPQLAELPSPLRDVSAALAKGSDEANDVAKLFAKQAGYQAVTRDDDGNLVIAKAPIVGDAAVAYQSAVKYTALTFGENEFKRQDLVFSKQFHNDPDGYLQAVNAFAKKHVAQFAQAAGPDVGAELSRSVENNISTNYRWLVLEQQRNIKHQFDMGTQAKIASSEQDAISLATSGDKGSPALQRAVDDVIRTNKLRVQNPVLNESPDVAALRIKQFDLKMGAARFVNGINTILQNPAGGVAAAQEAIDSHMKEKGLSPVQAQLDYAEGQKAIKDHIQNLTRTVELANKAKKIGDEQEEDKIVQDSASPNPTITENDIKTNPNMSPEAKMRMLGWIKRDGMPEPMARVSQGNTVDLFRRMALPEDDPQRITDLRPIRTAYINGQLSRQDEEWLEKRFKEGQSPDGTPLSKAKDRVIKAAAFDRSTLMNKDTTGPMAEYKFREYVDQRVDTYRKEGKDPMDLFNPAKPSDFIGKPEIIQWFRSTLDEQMKAQTQKIGGRPSTPPPGITVGPPTRQQGESIPDFMKRTGQSVP